MYIRSRCVLAFCCLFGQSVSAEEACVSTLLRECRVREGECICEPKVNTIVPFRVDQYIDIKLDGIMENAVPAILDIAGDNTKIIINKDNGGISAEIKGLNDNKARDVLEKLGASSTKIPEKSEEVK